MKRPVFIIIGAIIVFILLAIWVYMLFFGDPKNNPDTFTDFNFGDTTDPSVVIEDPKPENPAVVDTVSLDRLRQLTIKPIAGYQEVTKTPSSTPEIFYIETGTGQMFSINRETGAEKRISKTTIASTYRGVITPNGQYAMLQSGSGSGAKFTVGEISTSTDELIKQEISERIVDFSATTDNTFLYAVQTANSVIVKHYLPNNSRTETLFTIPFREAAIVWGDSATDTHYTYPKASKQLEGFVFQINNNKLVRLPIEGFGLSAVGDDTNVIYSRLEGENYRSYVYDLVNNRTSSAATRALPEKCTYLNNEDSFGLTAAICAADTLRDDTLLPDAWYQGTVSYADDLWEMQTGSTQATLLSATKQVSGRELDIIDLEVSPTDSTIYFINKNDGTLWLYERVQSSNRTSNS